MDNTFGYIIQAVRDQFKTNEFIPLHVPRFWGNEKAYLSNTIDSTFVSSVGAYVDKVEQQMEELTGAGKATAVVNGTAGLQVALRIAGVRPGDEVLTQALTFVATANAIAYNHARPVFIDVDKDTMGLSPMALQDFLEAYGEVREDGCYNRKTNKRIAACMPMHTFGFMCRIDAIVSICNTWNIPVVEDAAEALGSKFQGKSAGTFGQSGVFSFNGNKIITAGGGGVIVSREPHFASKAKYLTTTAKVPHKWEYVHDEMGYNFRMPNLNAALLSAQLEEFENYKNAKRNLYMGYKEAFTGKDIELIAIPEGTDWNYWLISVSVKDKRERDLLLKETNEQGIMTRPIWQLMYRLPMYENCQRDAQQNAEYLEERIVNIPSSATEG
jgi:aminotransferase in exopolysaccharide biosynthesis